jgi:hypothetical protein
VVCINDAARNYAALDLPMGGRKASGLGARHGAEGIRRFTAAKSVFVTRRASSREIFMYPNRRLKTAALRRGMRLT